MEHAQESGDADDLFAQGAVRERRARLDALEEERAAGLVGMEEIRRRPSTTDTYSMPQSQDEFFFSLPYDRMDLCLYAKDQGYAPEEASAALGFTVDQVDRIYRDIDAKRSAARYLHLTPLLVEPMRSQ